ncbi:MAG: ThiF family adenylyltransferase [Actinobacteria bacterium]|nr:ThiF family adenylyltransferase [Actinomycetota bacterium]
MTVYLAIDADRARTIAEDLLVESPREAGGFYALAAIRRGQRMRLLLGERFEVESHWDRQDVDLLTPNGQSISAAVSCSNSAGTGLAFVHTHPFDDRPPSLSAIDRRTAARLGRAFSDLIDGPFAALVVAPGGWGGAFVTAQGDLREIERIALVGRKLSVQAGRRQGRSRGIAFDDRQRRALGEASSAQLRSMHVTIVGVGGTGSPAAEILARMGVGRLTLIDPDIVEHSNVPRIFGAAASDVLQSRAKVDVVGDSVRRLGLGVDVLSVRGDIRDVVLQEHLLSADVVVGATDNHSSRAVMTELAVKAGLTFIDMGVRVGVRRNGDLDSLLLERRIQVPGGPCLWCWGRLDPSRIAEELLPADRKERLMAEGYVTGSAEAPEPSVTALTASAGAIASSGLLALLAGALAHQPLAVQIDTLSGLGARISGEDPDPDCICRKWKSTWFEPAGYKVGA